MPLIIMIVAASLLSFGMLSTQIALQTERMIQLSLWQQQLIAQRQVQRAFSEFAGELGGGHLSDQGSVMFEDVRVTWRAAACEHAAHRGICYRVRSEHEAHQTPRTRQSRLWVQPPSDCQLPYWRP